PPASAPPPTAYWWAKKPGSKLDEARRLNVRTVAEAEFRELVLHRADVRAAFQQMRCEGMMQGFDANQK
ncbi:MAG: hypothetical protein ABFS02_10905, partial [Pseudomonadota bacterium]